MTDKESAIQDLTDNEKYVLIILTDLPNDKQKIKIHTHHGDEGEIICEAGLKLMKTDGNFNTEV